MSLSSLQGAFLYAAAVYWLRGCLSLTAVPWRFAPCSQAWREYIPMPAARTSPIVRRALSSDHPQAEVAASLRLFQERMRKSEEALHRTSKVGQERKDFLRRLRARRKSES
jgi:hypothetical protein